MKEKLILRVSSKKVFEPYIRTYPNFQEKWLTRDLGLTKVVEGYLENPEFGTFLQHLRFKVGYEFSTIKREYKRSELTSAKLFKMRISATFEPTGEELGTKYLYKCNICKAGRTVKGNLILDLTKIPKASDIAKTIANDEWVVSERLASEMKKNRITGMELKPAQHYSKREPKTKWYHLMITNRVKVSNKTSYGDAFKPDIKMEDIISPCGHTIGGWPFSELFVEGKTWNGSDLAITDLYFGGHANLIYPSPAILISQRFYTLLKELKIRGYKVEIAHLT